MLDMVLRIRAAREDRVVLSNDRTMGTKWMAVLLLALTWLPCVSDLPNSTNWLSQTDSTRSSRITGISEFRTKRKDRG